ncbi:MAG: hypothetical protein ABI230_06310 [Aestuariivirga sp.]
MKKTLIALAAAATLAVGFSATANAHPIGFGGPHFGVVFSEGYGPGYYDAGYHGYGDRWHRPRCRTEWVGGRWGHHPHRILVCRR